MGAAFSLELGIWCKSTICYREGCGAVVVMPSHVYDNLVKSRSSFWCYNGHSQHFTGLTEEQKLRDQLASKEFALTRLREQNLTLEHSKNAYKGKYRGIKTRVANGVCPCCNRTFQNLMAHMKTKHPSYKEEL